MAGVGYGCAFLLAFVFVRAAVAKLNRPTETAAAFATMGLPVPHVLSRVVPTTELALAVALVASPPIGAVAAIAVLGVFSVVLSRHVGSEAGCGCFGSASTRPVSRSDLVRNAALAAMALVALLATSGR